MTTKTIEELLGKVKAHVALGAGVSGVTRREALIALDEIAAATAPSVLGEGTDAPDPHIACRPGDACTECEAEEKRERIEQNIREVICSLAFGEVPTCECGNDAVCVGWSEGRIETLAVMCDECCGHGNEDGWCVPLEKFYPSKRRAAPGAGDAPRCKGHCHCHAGADGIMHPPCCEECAAGAGDAGLRETARKCIEAVRAIGQRYRDDWSDFDGRTLKQELIEATWGLDRSLSPSTSTDAAKGAKP